MKVEFWMIGKTAFPYVQEGVKVFEKRIKRYIPYESVVVSDVKKAKNLSSEKLKEKEGEKVLSKLKKEDYVVLLDEGGRDFSSRKFANFMEKSLLLSHKRLIFVVGGAYGFSPDMYERANAKLSLSKMTFSHQIVRLFFLEQLYRAMTILRNEPYHND